VDRFISRAGVTRQRILRGGLAAGVAAALPLRVRAAERVSYAFPAPPFLPSFTPINVAHLKGYYREAGLDVEFHAVAGGVEVARRVADGQFDLGGATGDTPILARARGVPVKALAVLGGKSMTQIVIRRGSGIFAPEHFRGKTISVTSLTDTTYFTLLGFLASIGIRPEEVRIAAVGPVEVYQTLIDGKADAMAGVPDWVVAAQRSGLATMVFRSDEFFPSLAQALIASDRTIAARPQVLQAFVHATMRGLADTLREPDAAASLVARHFPQHRGQEAVVADVVRYFVRHVYPGQAMPGEINPQRLAKVQAFYLNRHIIERETPLRELYTPQFLAA